MIDSNSGVYIVERMIFEDCICGGDAMISDWFISGPMATLKYPFVLLVRGHPLFFMKIDQMSALSGSEPVRKSTVTSTAQTRTFSITVIICLSFS